ncbi:centromere protein V [Hydra vulgaris]|uniref:Centromere protein V n=1 Tax=Hydra vulgaris TaxID=6087 RepID=A0ABM4CMB7_HYDVU
MSETLYTGGCHCGAVVFEVLASSPLLCIRCNCSVCEKKQNIHFIVSKNKFKLHSGHDSLTTYTFNTHQAKHMFCKICGVQSFYVPRSNPNGIGVMPHCLDQQHSVEIQMQNFNGKDWELEMRTNIGDQLREISELN